MTTEPSEEIPATPEPPPEPAALETAPAVEAVPAEPEPPEEPAAPAARPLVKRHHGIVRFAHWANALLLLGMIGSGLQIYLAFPHFGPRGGPYYPNPWDGKPFPQGVRLGGWLAGGLNWHFALAWPFVLTGLLYLVYLAVSGEWRSLLFRPRDVPRAWQMQLYYLRLRKEHPPQGKHNALQKGAYIAMPILGFIAVVSGVAIWKPVQLSWLTGLLGGYVWARYWHFISMLILVALSFIHIFMVFTVDPYSLRSITTGGYNPENSPESRNARPFFNLLPNRFRKKEKAA